MITNRDKQAKASDFDCLKHPGRFLKAKANRMLRRDRVEVSGEDQEDARPWPSPRDARAKVKRSGVCPLCLGSLEKNAKKTRYERCCHTCDAHLEPGLICLHCSRHAIWRAADRSVCKGCGRSGTAYRG